MRKFENVNIISALQKIVDNNNLHYKTDFQYDIETLKEAAEGSHFYWMSRSGGTWLIPERNAHVRDTYDYNTWQYYTDTQYYGVKAFAVDVMGMENGRPFGDIYELNYNKHREEVRQNSFNAATVDVTFKATHIYPESTRTFDVAEYNDNWRAIIQRYGEAKTVRHNLHYEDESHLSEKLAWFGNQREIESEAVSVDDYVKEMTNARFHDYGYKQDDMVFTTVEDAYGAIKHNIPVYALFPDNTKEILPDKSSVNDCLYEGHFFGMSARDKQLLNFYQAGNTLDNLPLTRDELKTIFFMALDKGKENISDETERQTIDSIIHVLDKTLFATDSHNDLSIERNHEQDESEGYEP